MKTLLAALTALAFLGGVAAAQSLDTLVEIGDKPSASVGDLAAMAPAIAEMFSTGASERLAAELAKYDTDTPLTKARASSAAAKALRIRSSFFYLLFPIRRYAFRAMAADGVFGPGSSGGDPMSGVELIDFVSSLGRVYGGIR